MNFANGLGWPHLLILCIVVLLVFGSKRLPDTARSVGRSLRILKAETKGLRKDDEEEPPASTSASASTDDQARLARMQQQVEDLRTQLAARQGHD
ncbi:Sec-independent protein translocase subunit TatA [Actinocrispum wychmicini]|uniref:Sec-independent protein translocase protein TatA n=1 Tax=Actinocrispum wychmicini TaxID=1213861 RepID=A0A4R2JU95_9PSEU|nr:Sec-independent protein translocase subunit TatA [Actinocrispum wychmicini]TCO60878.1 TatA/E family protein of Tat protein translocase [Actinocrispum wychmicini]